MIFFKSTNITLNMNDDLFVDTKIVLCLTKNSNKKFVVNFELNQNMKILRKRLNVCFVKKKPSKNF